MHVLAWKLLFCWSRLFSGLPCFQRVMGCELIFVRHVVRARAPCPVTQGPRCRAPVLREGKNNHLRCYACMTQFCAGDSESSLLSLAPVELILSDLVGTGN